MYGPRSAYSRQTIEEHEAAIRAKKRRTAMTTPPTPAEMPKPDFTMNPGDRVTMTSNCVPRRVWSVENGTTTIERAYIEQHARAEKAEAECERLLNALKHIKQHQEIVGGSMAKMSAIWICAHNAIESAAALHPTTKGDEDE